MVEAAFQHRVWAAHIAEIERLSRPAFVICEVPADVAAMRHLQRGLDDANREWYHGDKRVEIYKSTGIIAPAGGYQAPNFEIPTLAVDANDEYAPAIEEIVRWVRCG